MVKSKVVQKHPVPEGHGSVHASFVVLQTEVKLVCLNQWKAFSKIVTRKRHNKEIDDDDASLALLQHRQEALNRVKGSLDGNQLPINWHLNPF